MFKALIKSSTLPAVLIFCGAAFAEEMKLTTDEINAALAGAKVEGLQDGARWSQSFGKNGATTYSSSGRVEIGSWRAENDQYCSQWPPRREWSCYDMTGKGNNVTFIPSGGGKPWPAEIVERR